MKTPSRTDLLVMRAYLDTALSVEPYHHNTPELLRTLQSLLKGFYPQPCYRPHRDTTESDDPLVKEWVNAARERNRQEEAYDEANAQALANVAGMWSRSASFVACQDALKKEDDK